MNSATSQLSREMFKFKKKLFTKKIETVISSDFRIKRARIVWLLHARHLKAWVISYMVSLLVFIRVKINDG